MFKQLNTQRVARFNSAISCTLIDTIQSTDDKLILDKTSKQSSKTFAPSSFRCPRRSWFRIRGTEPDVIRTPDRVLDFAAMLGSACHSYIQNILQQSSEVTWVDIDTYVSDSGVFSGKEYMISKDPESSEYRIAIIDPPIKFGCDGMVRIADKLFIVEIKSVDFGTWSDLTGPKSEHIPQVNMYGTLLNVPDILFIYIDRQYGDIKCYEHHISSADQDAVNNTISEVLKCVEYQIAPPPLPVQDKWCSENYCPYSRKCKQF